MFSFNGTYKSKPKQSLGGASKKEARDELVRRAAEDRLKRNHYKRNNLSAVKIQACYRSYRIRTQKKSEERASFDKLQNTPHHSIDNIYFLSRKLNFFYNPCIDKDVSRLIFLCQLFIKNKYDVISTLVSDFDESSPFNFLFFINKFCIYNCRLIYKDYRQPAIPIRFIEVFTSKESYLKTGDPMYNNDNCSTHDNNIHPDIKTMENDESRKIRKILLSIKIHLLKNGYFNTVNHLVHQRIPASIERSDDVTRISMASTIKDMLLKFVISDEAGNDDGDDLNGTYRNELMKHLTNEILCTQLTTQKNEFLHPILTSSVFPFSSLLQYLNQNCISYDDNTTNEPKKITADPCEDSLAGKKRDNVMDKEEESSNIFLLHSIIELASPHFASFQREDFQNFLSIVSHLSIFLEPASLQLSGDEEEEEEGEDGMEWNNEASNVTHIEKMKQKSIEMLGNNDNLASKLLFCINHKHLNDKSLVSLCRICYVVLHYGRSKITALKTKIFNSIVFNSSFLEHTWNIISTIHTTNILNEPTLLLQLISRGVNLTEKDFHIFIPLLSVFSTTLNHFLLTVSDAQFHDTSGSSSLRAFGDLKTVSRVALSLRDCCLGIIELTHPESKFSFKNTSYPFQKHQPSKKSYFLWKHRMLTQTFKDVVKLVKQLYERDCRQAFCPPNCWLASNHIVQSDKVVQSLSDVAIEYIGSPFGTLSILNGENNNMRTDLPHLSTNEIRKLIVLSELPFIIPFVRRVEIFRELIRRVKMGEAVDPFFNSRYLTIRRNFLYEDAYEKLRKEPTLKKPLRIHLINAAGLDEAGVDGGGLFREFMAELVKAGFNPNRGFFRTTPDKLHYPNPQSQVLYPEDYLQHYHFLGRILGKVIFDEMLIDVPFASFFLCKLLSRADLDIHHLASLDPEMHKNLLFIKDFDGDVSDMGLTFSVTYDKLGAVATDELKPGGENIPVTNQNRYEYVHLMADYRLNRQIKQHCGAFRKGLSDVVPMQWLHLFDHKELQVLLSGADTPIDIQDLCDNTVYSGGYTSTHPVILMFWKVVNEFTSEQKKMLLKFVTSCSRAPLLGFKELYPAFGIQMAGRDADRLPTSSTCMNLLKLPEFSDINILRSKLLYALESGAGFELS